MKLQKLLFYAYGWYYALFDKKLFGDSIQAWQYGPVIPAIYHDVKGYGNYPITTLISKGIGKEGSMFSFHYNTPKVDAEKDGELINFLDAMWNVYSKYSAVNLSTATHAVGTPWHDVAKTYDFVLPKGAIINDSLIKDYFISEKKKIESKN
ncbi:Panacea domain-containing protein [Chitinophaga terrae (ex Kim and Jung 2007)]|nr:type II toxin-antitoxin system antitoxin SocA domain-containing protein [Chitinophaga terrae (ex Kim and Jung 2007)]MDQ0108245.1 putative phage-associated protein [Chitinophaga terrae (ex Kim and Jung 2007)]